MSDTKICNIACDGILFLGDKLLESTESDELLIYADKLSMAHGLEVRVPYLDREIVEYHERLRANSKYGAGPANGCTDKFAGNFFRRG